MQKLVYQNRGSDLETFCTKIHQCATLTAIIIKTNSNNSQPNISIVNLKIPVI